ncbi:hypothetical protein SDC9_163978 [bioreactor metagenome]|uniref:CGGC domain-containing protein n=1 Tax=bioreactor metagenome TaxID=1076179 RepID=A0A645FXJ9_9ZZZZ|nr:hypothetical protein [Lachnospiraceae bacterium]
MKIGIKYCGGCNSTYDRKSLYDRLKSEYPNHEIEAVKAGKAYDLLVVLCGCKAQCADISAYSSDAIVFVTEEYEYEDIKKFL